MSAPLIPGAVRAARFLLLLESGVWLLLSTVVILSMGIHTGQATPTDGTYSGLAARVEPSISVNRKVIVPLGISVTGPSVGWIPTPTATGGDRRPPSPPASTGNRHDNHPSWLVSDRRRLARARPSGCLRDRCGGHDSNRQGDGGCDGAAGRGRSRSQPTWWRGATRTDRCLAWHTSSTSNCIDHLEVPERIASTGETVGKRRIWVRPHSLGLT
jgi:hypothetical protein